ncbi:uncharacterized protein LOC135169371 [Diachasmimorpha longicaudata]|uniref:uncharacterized protein LOC135169371 n=1 Tax=Diachasmimorpha longicaudata TaxID=58733 RepID=UPI0030B8E79F
MAFRGKILLQASRAKFIENLRAESTSASVRTLTVAELQSKLDMLENHWALFDSLHLKLLMAKDNEEVLDHAYVKEEVYDKCLSMYSAARSTFIGLIKGLDDSIDLSESFRRPSVAPPPASVAHRQLPKISLPTFSGTFSEWTPYKDLFLSMVVGSSALSTVEKFHYLLTSLTGEPKQLISTLPVTEDAFLPAWNALLARYENKRRLVSIQLGKLFAAPRFINRTAKEYNALLNSVAEAVTALESLGRPVEHWDDMLVHLVSKRLDAKMLEAWEIELGSSSEFPTYAALREFVLGRARARETMEMHASEPPSAASSNPHRASKPRP